jgi:hypothetical protein
MQEQHFTFVKLGNLLALLRNATPLVNRLFTEMSKKRQRCAVVNLENNCSIPAKFTDVYSTVIVSNNYPRTGDKMDFTIEEEAFLLECYSRNGATNKKSIIKFLDNAKVQICMYVLLVRL